MILVDVNVLVRAHREDAPDHARYRSWLEEALGPGRALDLAEPVLSGFLRIVTHPKIFVPPSPIEIAISFVSEVREHPSGVLVRPGPRHWEIFLRLCRETQAKGNLVPDAYLAALAIEGGIDLFTTDRDFARFKGLRAQHPLA